MTTEAKTLAEWAREHLLYEAETLKYATEQLGLTEKGPKESALLQSFVVNARCLNDFLWHDRNPRHPDDAFAADFCLAGTGAAIRGDLPQVNLEDIRKRQRFGREVMHLSYARISGWGDEKKWACGMVFAELTVALEKFAEVSKTGSLDQETRGRLCDLLPRDEATSGLAYITGATGINLRTTGGTINLADVNPGGKR